MGGIAFDDLADVRPVTGNGLLVVDALNLSFRWKHSGQFDFAEDFCSTVESLARSYKCRDIIILTDYKGSSYRTGIDPEYKGNRKEKYKDQSDADKHDFQEFIEGFNHALALAETKWLVCKIEGVEADDMAAYITKTRPEYKHIWLVSTDKDWNLLINDRVSRFSYITRKDYTLENWDEYNDVSIDKYIDLKVLEGDKGDNVPGIPGIGPKRGAGLIKQYGSAFDIYASIPIPGKAKYIQNLNDSEDRILLNYRLMDLLTYCEEAIGKDNLHILEREL
jgi:5'-3' exonuclease